MNAASHSSSSRALPKSTPASNSGCAVDERGPWAAVARRDGVVRKRCRRAPQPKVHVGSELEPDGRVRVENRDLNDASLLPA